MWLTGRLAPDFKTVADFRRDNGFAIRQVCSQFIVLCRRLKLYTQRVVAIEGSNFTAVVLGMPKTRYKRAAATTGCLIRGLSPCISRHCSCQMRFHTALGQEQTWQTDDESFRSLLSSSSLALRRLAMPRCARLPRRANSK